MAQSNCKMIVMELQAKNMVVKWDSLILQIINMLLNIHKTYHSCGEVEQN